MPNTKFHFISSKEQLGGLKLYLYQVYIEFQSIASCLKKPHHHHLQEKTKCKRLNKREEVLRLENVIRINGKDRPQRIRNGIVRKKKQRILGCEGEICRVYWNKSLVFYQNSEKDTLLKVSQVYKKPKGSQQQALRN